jgi:diguanylate cyclase (GGDEF)-like protein
MNTSSTNRGKINDSSILPILQQAFDGIALLVPQPWRIVFANPALAAWLGRGAEDLLGQPIGEILDAERSGELLDQLDRVWQNEPIGADFLAYLRNSSCQMPLVQVRLCRVVLGDGQFIAINVRKALDPAHVMAPTAGRLDPLTMLPDRAFLESRLEALLQFAVLFVDLNNFKQINDSYGHVVGDQVLRECAQRLAGCVRHGDHVARFGGDEFVVLLEQVAGSEEIEPVVERIHLALGKPIVLPGGEFFPTVSIGVAEATSEHQSPTDLLQDADRAMYASKRIPV